MLDDLSSGALALGIRLDAATIVQFEHLLRLLQSANAGLNLTAVREDKAIVQRHFLDSISVGSCLEQRGLLSEGVKVLDLGSGAGFPGLPLKLVWPRLSLSLLEATGKKARFIQTAIEGLRLQDSRVLAGRAETFALQADLRETQDIVVARAVAAMSALVELALPFLRLGGTLAAVKGSRASQELAAAEAALRECGGQSIGEVNLSAETGLRMVLIRKVSTTPPRYPRRPGQPAAHPIHDRS